MTEKKDPIREFQHKLDLFGRVTRVSFGNDPDKLVFRIEPFTYNIVIPIEALNDLPILINDGYRYDLELTEWTHEGLNIQLRGSK